MCRCEFLRNNAGCTFILVDIDDWHWRLPFSPSMAGTPFHHTFFLSNLTVALYLELVTNLNTRLKLKVADTTPKQIQPKLHKLLKFCIWFIDIKLVDWECKYNRGMVWSQLQELMLKVWISAFPIWLVNFFKEC